MGRNQQKEVEEVAAMTYDLLFYFHFFKLISQSVQLKRDPYAEHSVKRAHISVKSHRALRFYAFATQSSVSRFRTSAHQGMKLRALLAIGYLKHMI